MSLDINSAIANGVNNDPVLCSLSGISLQVAIDAVSMFLSSYSWYPPAEDENTAQNAIDTTIRELSTPITMTTFPIGTILPFAGSVSDIPTNWLHCNGASLSTDLYTELFALIGYKFGGSGSLYYLPETRLKFLRGGNTDSGTTGGSSTATLSGIHIPAHTHTVTGYTTSAAFVGAGTTTRYPPTSNGTTIASGSYGGSAGVAQPFSIIPPYVEVIYMIYAGTI